MRNAKPGVPFVPKDEAPDMGEFLVGFAPGTIPEKMLPGQAKLIKAGSDVVFQMHYTANGTAGVDRSKLGVVFAKEAPVERVMTLAAGDEDFRIPPGAANHRVDAQFEVGTDVKLTRL